MPDQPLPERPSPIRRYARLPDPVRSDQMVTTSEASRLPDEKDDYWREVEWMLRLAGGGF